MQYDDWLTGRWNNVPPEARVREPTSLARIDQYVADHFPTLLSLLVLSHGALVFERYYQSGVEDCVNVKSVTKSIISALVGIALREGYLSSLDQRVSEFFPQYLSATDDPRKREITLKHLLTLCSGLSWAEHESIPALVASDHWVQYALSLPLRHAPGKRFVYSTLDAHLLSAILSQATGSSTLAFANTYLFGPLGSTITQWTRDPQGYPLGGSELYLTPRDMAKFGFLYVRDGQWDGKQLIPEEYFEASIHTQVSTSISVGANTAMVLPDSYGYLWWVSTVGPYPSFFALGFGGQTIYVIPNLDVVLVTTARTDVPAEQGAGRYASTMAHDIAEHCVLPALAP